MPDQIYIGNFPGGQTTNRQAYVINNNSFVTLFNAYAWRGQVKRKRGTLYLGRLTRQIQSVPSGPLSWQFGPITLVAGFVNLFTFIGLTPSLGASITPGSITFVVGANTYTESVPFSGVLVGTPAGSGTINYATGDVTITAGGAGPMIGTFAYFPSQPSLGLEDFSSSVTTFQYPSLLAFDQTYSYQCNQAASNAFFFSTSYYKISNNPVAWTGQNYQQFWTTNYSGALWATNNKPGFNFKLIQSIVFNSPQQLTITVLNTVGVAPVIVGDMVWTNEIVTNSTVNAVAKLASVNGQTGTVFSVTEGPPGTFTLVVNFPNSIIIDPAAGDAGKIYSGGIIQLLTNSLNQGAAQDGIRWYDGDPTSGTGLPTGTGKGWVNFAPPLTATAVSIDKHPIGTYYLVGALAILPFKNRILFFSPSIQTSSGLFFTLQDSVLWSWDGTPYYAGLVPAGQTFDIRVYYVDQTGLGGYLPAGISNPIATISNNEDALLIGFGGDGRKTRFVFSGNDLNPFSFYFINSEMPSSATYSAVAFDRGVIDIGPYGIAITDQQSCQRIDLDIPDSVFQIQSPNHGVERVNAIRDFFREWIYFSYPVNDSQWVYPTQTFLFNYRDNTWAILYENFTAHGNYRASTKRTWQTLPFKTWQQWREPWNAGSSSQLFPDIIAGTPQGFVLITSQGTGEAQSGTISAITNMGGLTQITSFDHCVTDKNINTDTSDFLYFNGLIGILNSTITGITLGASTIITTTNTFSTGQFVTPTGIMGTTQLNNNSYLVLAATGANVTLDVDSTLFTPWAAGGTLQFSFNGLVGKVLQIIDANNFIVDLLFPPGTYVGGGTFARLSQPLIQTKQFPFYWEIGRKIRLSVQKYLFDATANSQITVDIYLSQDGDNAWNNQFNSGVPNGLIYSQTLFTCPESTNIGLTPANTNLQMPIAESQKAIWHRFNTSLIGDSVQIGFTLSDAQMKNITYATSEIALQGIELTVNPGPHLA